MTLLLNYCRFLLECTRIILFHFLYLCPIFITCFFHCHYLMTELRKSSFSSLRMLDMRQARTGRLSMKPSPVGAYLWLGGGAAGSERRRTAGPPFPVGRGQGCLTSGRAPETGQKGPSRGGATPVRDPDPLPEPRSARALRWEPLGREVAVRALGRAGRSRLAAPDPWGDRGKRL